MNKLLDKLDYKIGKYAPSNIILFFILGQAAVFFINFLKPELNASYYLYFDSSLVLQGQWWRLVSFLFLPPDISIVFVIIALYFYYMIGTSLENQWGSFKFNCFYFIGAVGMIISGFITGYADSSYLNLSMFFAFAVLYPNYQIRLFFLFPIEIKWLAAVDAVFYIFMLVTGTFTTRIAIVFSLLNFFLFFMGDFIKFIKNQIYYFKHWKNNHNKWKK